ncbi:chascon [Anaeramoeba flamelloides]|uniref:Chascon n=1 Tax=Anaeramoeba flamelloides TaxID=1746091 RepID=A0ABQ8YAE3_9EUKA|nr:chascon [Anaeramoeba flamelloides]
MSHSSQNIERLLERVSKILPQTQRQNLPKTISSNKHHESQQKHSTETNNTRFRQDLNELNTPYTSTNPPLKDPIPKTKPFIDLDFLNENTFDLDQFERNEQSETEPTQTSDLNYFSYPIDRNIQNLKSKEEQNFLIFDKKTDHYPQLNNTKATNALKKESEKEKEKEKEKEREKEKEKEKEQNYKNKKEKDFLINSKKIRSYSLNNRLRKVNSPEKQEDSNLIKLRRSENEINQLLEKVKQTQNKISPKKEQKTIHSNEKQNLLNNQIFNLNHSLDSLTNNKNTTRHDRDNYNNHSLPDNNKIRRNTLNNNNELLKLLSRVKRIQTNNQINAVTGKNHNLNNGMVEFVLVSATNNKIKNKKLKNKKTNSKKNLKKDFDRLLKKEKLNQKYTISEKQQEQQQQKQQQQQQQQKPKQQQKQPKQKQKQKINQIEIFQLLNRAKQIRNKIQSTNETHTIPNKKPLKKFEIEIKNESKEKNKKSIYNPKNYQVEGFKSKIEYNSKNENLKAFKDQDDDRNKFQNNNKNKNEEKKKEKEKEKEKENKIKNSNNSLKSLLQIKKRNDKLDNYLNTSSRKKNYSIDEWISTEEFFDINENLLITKQKSENNLVYKEINRDNNLNNTSNNNNSNNNYNYNDEKSMSINEIKTQTKSEITENTEDPEYFENIKDFENEFIDVEAKSNNKKTKREDFQNNNNINDDDEYGNSKNYIEKNDFLNSLNQFSSKKKSIIDIETLLNRAKRSEKNFSNNFNKKDNNHNIRNEIEFDLSFESENDLKSNLTSNSISELEKELKTSSKSETEPKLKTSSSESSSSSSSSTSSPSELGSKLESKKKKKNPTSTTTATTTTPFFKTGTESKKNPNLKLKSNYNAKIKKQTKNDNNIFNLDKVLENSKKTLQKFDKHVDNKNEFIESFLSNKKNNNDKEKNQEIEKIKNEIKLKIEKKKKLKEKITEIKTINKQKYLKSKEKNIKLNFSKDATKEELFSIDLLIENIKEFILLSDLLIQNIIPFFESFDKCKINVSIQIKESIKKISFILNNNINLIANKQILNKLKKETNDLLKSFQLINKDNDFKENKELKLLEKTINNNSKNNRNTISILTQNSKKTLSLSIQTNKTLGLNDQIIKIIDNNLNILNNKQIIITLKMIKKSMRQHFNNKNNLNCKKINRKFNTIFYNLLFLNLFKKELSKEIFKIFFENNLINFNKLILFQTKVGKGKTKEKESENANESESGCENKKKNENEKENENGNENGNGNGNENKNKSESENGNEKKNITKNNTQKEKETYIKTKAKTKFLKNYYYKKIQKLIYLIINNEIIDLPHFDQIIIFFNLLLDKFEIIDYEKISNSILIQILKNCLSKAFSILINEISNKNIDLKNFLNNNNVTELINFKKIQYHEFDNDQSESESESENGSENGSESESESESERKKKNINEITNKNKKKKKKKKNKDDNENEKEKEKNDQIHNSNLKIFKYFNKKEYNLLIKLFQFFQKFEIKNKKLIKKIGSFLFQFSEYFGILIPFIEFAIKCQTIISSNYEQIFGENSLLYYFFLEYNLYYGKEFLLITLRKIVKSINEKEITFNKYIFSSSNNDDDNQNYENEAQNIKKENDDDNNSKENLINNNDDKIEKYNLFLKNQENLKQYLPILLSDIFISQKHLPAQFKFICSELKNNIETKFPNETSLILSRFLFDGFYCLAIEDPYKFSIIRNQDSVQKKQQLQNFQNLSEILKRFAHGKVLELFQNDPKKEKKLKKINKIFSKNFPKRSIFIKNCCRIRNRNDYENKLSNVHKSFPNYKLQKSFNSQLLSKACIEQMKQFVKMKKVYQTEFGMQNIKSILQDLQKTNVDSSIISEQLIYLITQFKEKLPITLAKFRPKTPRKHKTKRSWTINSKINNSINHTQHLTKQEKQQQLEDLNISMRGSSSSTLLPFKKNPTKYFQKNRIIKIWNTIKDEESLKESVGFLQQNTNKKLANKWTKKYFILKKNRFVIFRKRPKNKKIFPNNIIKITESTEIRDLTQKKTKKKHLILILNPKLHGQILIGMKSKSEQNKWKDVFEIAKSLI